MPRTREVLQVARRMPDGRLGIIERDSAAPAKVLSRADQLAQATAMMHRRLFDPNASITALAEEFGLAPQTVTRRLQMARADGIPDEARRIFIQDMLPLAMVVLQETLAGDDKKLAAQVALKVVDGLKALELPQAASSTVEETLEAWRVKVTRKGTDAHPARAKSDRRPNGEAGIIDAVPVEAATPPQIEAGSGEGAEAVPLREGERERFPDSPA